MCIHHSGVCLVKYKNCDCLAAGLSSAAFDMIDIQILLIYNIFRNAKYYNKMNGGSTMNIGFWSCMMLVPFFALFALIFYIGKEKATGLLAGFNNLPEKERALYDRARMAKDSAGDFAVWALIMFIGALVSQWISPYAIVAYVVWVVLLFKDMHLDARKAFEKYLLK